MRRIALWNTAFLGDAALTLPLLRAVAAVWPDAAIDLYVRRGVGPLLAAQPELAAVYEYDKRAAERGPLALLRLGREAAGRRYNLWLGAHLSPRSALTALCSGAGTRVGYTGGPLQRLCYTATVPRRFGELHEIERLMELLRPVLPSGFSLADAFADLCPPSPPCHPSADLPTESAPTHPGAGPAWWKRPAAPLPPPLPAPWPELVLPPAARDKARAFRQGISGPLLGIHPGSAWPTKRWSAAGFAEIARRASAAGAHVLLFGAGREERALAATVARLAGLTGHPRLHDVSDALNLPELAAFIAVLDCCLVNDSGPMHLAWIQRTPVTAIFGPTVPAFGFTPRGAGASVIDLPLGCRPCGRHGHTRCPRGHHACMNGIGADLVWADVEGKLRAAGADGPTPRRSRPTL